MFPLSIYQTLLCGPWLFDDYVSYNEHDSFKHQVQALAFASFLPSHKHKRREDERKSSTLVKIWNKRTISKSKPIFASLLIDLNTREEVIPLHPFIQSPKNEF